VLDKSVIMARLASLDRYVSRLRRFESISLEAYLSDYDTQAIVERNLQLAIQVCMDIANYIIARGRLTFPADQENIFTPWRSKGKCYKPGFRYAKRQFILRGSVKNRPG